MATEHAQVSSWRNNLLPHIVDHLATVRPDAVYAEYPISLTTYEHGYRRVTYRGFANAINGLAWWLTQTLGPAKDFEVIAYIGPNDIRYTALVLGAVKAGYVLLLTSPRNSIAAQNSLFSKLNCTKLLSSDPKPPPMNTILESCNFDHFAVPSVEELLDVHHPHYAYNKSYPEAKSEPLFVIHTSGSTGIPKPLIYRHESATRNMNMLAEDPPPGFISQDRMFQGKRVINAFPPFHGAGLVSHLFQAIPFGTTMIAPVSGAIPTAQGIGEALKTINADVGFFVPSIMLELSQDMKVLESVASRLEFCLYCGGDLPQAVGDIVSSKLRLVCQYGASEIGLTPQVLPQGWQPSDWKYVCLHPCMGVTYHGMADGVSELVVKRDEAKKETQPTFVLFPELQEYGSRDLFEQHPSIPELWAWRARADDIIVLLNGEKTNPISLEQHIVAENADIGAAIVIGAQRLQAALMLEPVDQRQDMSLSEKAALIDKVWPSVEEANSVTPAHARIEKTMILMMSPDKPVIKAGKGTIQRAATVNQYTEEIDKLYQDIDLALSEDGMNITNGDAVDGIDAISALVRKVITSKFQLFSELTDSDDLYQLGMDSLAALGLTRSLRNALGLKTLSLSTIYNNPSVRQLAQAIEELKSNQNLDVESKESRKEVLTATLDEYVKKLHNVTASAAKALTRDQQVVVLTGSTGTLGTYILSALLANPKVAHIYCLNRSKDSKTRQQASFKKSNLPQSGLDNRRVSFYQSDLSQPLLGLESSVLDSIRETATLIIHNAWPVNFNLPLDSFRPHLQGVTSLLSLAASAPHYRPALFFVSSISSVLDLRTAAGVTAEEVIVDAAAPFANGYAESKWVSERLCEEAARALDLPVSFARVGQVAGPVRQAGLWNPVEWLPSLVASSLSLKALPDSLGKSMDTVNWIPVDLLAEAIVELTVEQRWTNAQENGATVFHLQNPMATSWEALLPVVTSTAQSLLGHSVEIVPSETWLARLRSNVDNVLNSDADQMANGDKGTVATNDRLEATLTALPAGKLLEFFTASMSFDAPGTNTLDQSVALAGSTTLRSMHAVDDKWMGKWMGEWIQNIKEKNQFNGNGSLV